MGRPQAAKLARSQAAYVQEVSVADSFGERLSRRASIGSGLKSSLSSDSAGMAGCIDTNPEQVQAAAAELSLDRPELSQRSCAGRQTKWTRSPRNRNGDEVFLKFCS